MAITALTNQLKGVANISLVDTDTNTALVLNTATGFKFNRGITEEVIKTMNDLAEMVTATAYIKEQSPIIEMVFPSKTPEAIGVSWNLKWGTQATATSVEFAKQFLVTRNNYAALGAGFEGAGIQADEPLAIGAYLQDTGANIQTSVPMTLGTYATMNVATDTFTFGIDADGALRFTNDLIGKYVHVVVPYQLTGIQVLTEEPFRKLKLTATMPTIGLDNLIQLQFPDVEAQLDNAALDFTTEGQPVAFRANNDGSTCIPFTMKSLALQRRCVA